MAGNTEIVKGIFQLEVDAKGVEEGLRHVAGQYAKVTTAVNDQNAELKKLAEQEKQLQLARANANNPSIILKYDEKLSEVKTKIENLNKATVEQSKSQRELQRESEKTGNKLDKAFKTTTVNAVTNGIKQTNKELENVGKAATDSGAKLGKEGGKAVNAFQKLRVELKAAKGELAEAIAGGNADAIDAASQKVGALKDQINDLNESADNFASGSKFQQIGNIFGDITQNVLALDFGRANEQSQTLLKTTKSLTFKEAVTGVKDLGATFVNIGKSLLLNPIFLIATVVTLIIAKFDALREAGGLIGSIFNGIGKAIGVVVDLGKDLLDFLGLIDSTRKSLEQLIDQQETLIKTTENYFNRSIALRKAAQQSTIQLENEKADAVNKALLKELNDTKERLLEKASSYEDYYDLQKKLIDIGLRASQVATEKEVRNIEVEKAARLKLLELQQQIVAEQNKAREQTIGLTFDPDSAKKIKAQFDLQRKALKEQRDEEKRQVAIDLVDAGSDKIQAAKAKINQKYAIINKSLRQKESAEILEAEFKLADQRLESAKVTEELLSDIAFSQGALTEVEVAEEKVVVLAKYYNDKIKLAEDNIAKEKKLGFTTIEAEKAVQALRKQGEADVIKAQDDLSKKRVQLNLEQLDEEKRHTLAMLSIYNERKLRFFEVEDDRRLQELKKEIEFEEEKLRVMKDGGEATTEELKKQQNTTDELKAKADAIAKKAEQEKIEGVIDGIFATVAATIAASNAIVSIYADQNDKLTSLQQKRVDDAKNIADKGNAELLELEEKRLEDLNKKRESFVRIQQSLAAVEMVANAGVAITKAAMDGGVAAPFTIATTILALVAGLAQARAIASQAAFYEGGLFEGYTGDGNPRDESVAVGRKPYTYHKQEFIFDHKNTRKYKDIFDGVHKGRIDLSEWREKVKAFDSMNTAKGAELAGVLFPPAPSMDISELQKQLETLTKVVKNQSMYINFDDQGFTARMTNIQAKNDFIKNTLAKP